MVWKWRIQEGVEQRIVFRWKIENCMEVENRGGGGERGGGQRTKGAEHRERHGENDIRRRRKGNRDRFQSVQRSQGQKYSALTR